MKEKTRRMETIVKITTLEGVKIPEYATSGSSGIDLINHSFKSIWKGNKEVDISKLSTSVSRGAMMLRPYERVLIGTGLFLEIPEGHELQVRMRSGSSLKRGLQVSNSPGTIDSDYRGEVGIIIYNSTQFLAEIKLGESIAQGVLQKVERIKFQPTGVLSETLRSGSGYGSTDLTESKSFTMSYK